MIARIGLRNHGLTALSEVIHDIDLKESKYHRGETDGLSALLTGLVAAESDDDQRMAQGAQLIENLSAFYQRQKEN